MSERRGFKDQISDVLTESLPDPTGGTLEKWLAPTTESRIEQIPVERIRDRAVRGEVDVTESQYRALRASIRASGVLQPLLLRAAGEGQFEVVSGARRLRAARDTAQPTVPAVVRELNDVQALVGGSWDAVLRSGLSPRESQALVVQLVGAGMDEGEATALVATAPVREETATEVAAAVDSNGAAGVAAPEAAVSEPPADVAAAEPEASVDAAVAPDVAEPPVEAAAAPEPDVSAETAAAVEAAELSAEVAAAPEGEAAVAASEPDASAETAAAVDAGEPSAEVAPAPEVEAAAATPEAEASSADAAALEPSEPSAGEAVTSPESAADAPVAESHAAAESAAPEAATSPEADVDFDEDAMGWPAPDDALTATAPTTPPTPLPVDPTRFPVAPLASESAPAAAEAPAVPSETPSNGASPDTPITEAPPTVAAPSDSPSATATVDTAAAGDAAAQAPDAAAQAAATSAEAPDAAAGSVVADPTAEAPAAEAPSTEQRPSAADASPATLDEPAGEPVVVAPADAAAQAGATTPHVIRINLPDPASAVAEDESAPADGSMPVAAPAATNDAEPGSRLVAPPAETASPAAAAPSRPAVPVPALLRRGPLFYAVLGIGLAVGAIVFILTSVLEGVGGTTSIIAAVVVAVVGFVTAMVSLAQPRSRA